MARLGRALPNRPIVSRAPLTTFYRDGTSGNASGPLVLTIPATVQVGDAMFIVSIYKIAVGTGSIDTPAGWSVGVSPVDLTGASANSAIFYRAVQAGDAGSTVTLTPSSGAQQNEAVLVAYAGVSTIPRNVTFADQGTTASTSVLCTGPAYQAGDLVALVGGVRGSTNGTVTFTAPAGYTMRQQVTAPSGAAQDVACFVADGWPGGDQTVTASRASWAISGQLVLQPIQAGAQNLTRPSADTVTVGDGVTASVALPRAVAEATGLADAYTRTLGLSRDAAGTVAGADATARVFVAAGVGSDAVSVADTPTRGGLVLARDLNDALTVTDTGARTVAASRAVGETVSGADQTSQAGGYPRGVGDAANAAGVAARALVAPRGAADTVAVVDTATRAAQTVARVSAETVTALDAPVGARAVSRFVAETVTAVAAPTGTLGATRSVSDTAGVAETASRVVGSPRAVVDAFTVEDDAGWQGNGGATVAEAVHPVDAPTLVQTFTRAGAETVAVGGTAAGQVGTSGAAVGESTTLADTATRAAGTFRTAPNTITATDTAEGVYSRTAVNADTVSAVDGAVAAGSPGRANGNSAVFTDATARAVTRSRSVGDAAGLTDESLAGRLHTGDAADAVTTVDAAAAAQHTWGRGGTDTVGLVAAPTRTVLLVRGVADLVGRGGFGRARAGWFGDPSGGLVDTADRFLHILSEADDTVGFGDANARARASTRGGVLEHVTLIAYPTADPTDPVVVIVVAYPSTVSERPRVGSVTTSSPPSGRVLVTVSPGTVRRTR